MTTSEHDAPDAFNMDLSMPSIEGGRDPRAIYRQLRERGPVVRVHSVGGITAYAVTRYDEVVEGLQDRRFSKDFRKATAIAGDSGARQSGFVLSGTGTRHLLNTDAPDHTRLRKLVSRAFTTRRMQTLRPRIQQIVDDLLATMATRPRADLIGDLAFPLSITVICELLGVPHERRAEFRAWSTSATTPTTAEDAAEGAIRLNEYLAELIESRRLELASTQDPAAAPDLLSGMITAQDEGDRLSESELLGMAFLLLIAGHETTVGLIGTALLELCRRPDQRRLLLDDPALVVPAIEEFLRFDGPVQRATFRAATEDIELGGVLIPAGSVVTMMVGSANCDPRQFPDPDQVDITRDTRHHVAFGQGAHFCLGAQLARQEARVAVSSLLRRFPGYALGIPESELTYQPTVIRALASLPVVLGPSHAP